MNVLFENHQVILQKKKHFRSSFTKYIPKIRVMKKSIMRVSLEVHSHDNFVRALFPFS